MRKILLATSALVLSGGAALAADLPTYEPAPAAPVAAPTYDWTGGYVGLQTGWSWANVETDYNFGPVAGPTGSFDVDSDGWTLGARAGWDYQWNWAVLGIQGDINWLDVDGDGNGGTTTVVNGMEANWLASLTGRIGAGIDRFHPYVLGGVSYVDYEHNNSYAPAALADSDDDGDFGWTLGAGLEVAVTDNISVTGEYRHYWFNDKNITYANGSTAKFDTDMDAFTVGVNWRFGGPGAPVAANY